MARPSPDTDHVLACHKLARSSPQCRTCAGPEGMILFALAMLERRTFLPFTGFPNKKWDGAWVAVGDGWGDLLVSVLVTPGTA